jgi:hypothetical protein
MSYAVAGEIECELELAEDEIELIEDYRDLDEDELLVDWTGTVRILAEFGVVALRGRKIGKTHIVAVGTAELARDATLTVELELGGERFQALCHVESSTLRQGRWSSSLRIGATSPRGNDLISRQVRRGRIALAPQAWAA